MDRYVAFIPVRGGSKSIPLKNIKELNRRPLVYWTLDAAVQCKKIDRVYVCTDSGAIREKVDEYAALYQCRDKLLCIDRPRETATDIASTESAMLYFAGAYPEFERLVLIQATSPLLSAEHLSQAIEHYEAAGYDSLLSVVRQKRFCWVECENGYRPVNYNYNNRPRRQEFDGYLVENGAFYINTRTNLLESKCRLSGSVGVYVMPEETYFEIDEPSDWVIVEQLLKKRASTSRPHFDRIGRIKMLITDCDGVMTDGGMYYSELGDEGKKFNTRDGMAVQLLHKHGIRFGIITGENVDIVRRRAEKLHVDECHIGVPDKTVALDAICAKYGLTDQEIAYIGDDLNDIGVLQRVGLPCSVADGIQAAKSAALYVTRAKGGQGAVREVAELLIQNKEFT